MTFFQAMAVLAEGVAVRVTTWGPDCYIRIGSGGWGAAKHQDGTDYTVDRWDICRVEWEIYTPSRKCHCQRCPECGGITGAKE